MNCIQVLPVRQLLAVQRLHRTGGDQVPQVGGAGEHHVKAREATSVSSRTPWFRNATSANRMNAGFVLEALEHFAAGIRSNCRSVPARQTTDQQRRVVRPACVTRTCSLSNILQRPRWLAQALIAG